MGAAKRRREYEKKNGIMFVEKLAKEIRENAASAGKFGMEQAMFNGKPYVYGVDWATKPAYTVPNEEAEQIMETLPDLPQITIEEGEDE